MTIYFKLTISLQLCLSLLSPGHHLVGSFLQPQGTICCYATSNVTLLPAAHFSSGRRVPRLMMVKWKVIMACFFTTAHTAAESMLLQPLKPQKGRLRLTQICTICCCISVKLGHVKSCHVGSWGKFHWGGKCRDHSRQTGIALLSEDVRVCVCVEVYSDVFEHIGLTWADGAKHSYLKCQSFSFDGWDWSESSDLTQ